MIYRRIHFFTFHFSLFHHFVCLLEIFIFICLVTMKIKKIRSFFEKLFEYGFFFVPLYYKQQHF